MTTYDAKGRMMSTFRPPTDATGRAIPHREWLAKSVVGRYGAGESCKDIESHMYRQLGESIVWHGNADRMAESIRIAIAALRAACGYPAENVPQLREPQE